MNDTVSSARAVAADRLTISATGHADPEQLLDVLADADTRTVSTGLTYLADRTAIPATFQAAPDAPCEAYAWCAETGKHLDHIGRRVELPTEAGRPPILEAYFYTDEPADVPVVTYSSGSDAWQDFTSSAQMRAETARVRAHLARLDALADAYDALREADDPNYVGEAVQPGAAALALQLADLITAEVRGPAWMAEYGCTPFCVMDHTERDNNPGWHQGPTIAVPLPGPLCAARMPGQDTSDPDDEPLFAARVNTTNDEAEAFGVTTTLWVDVPGDTMELTLAQTDRFIAGLESFLPQLRALRALQAEAEKGDRPGNPVAKAAYRAAREARAEAERAAAEDAK